jgi:Adenylate and Guanylate cyclase catalytic domain
MLVCFLILCVLSDFSFCLGVFSSVNTAARMESTGTRGKIQLSESTAEILVAAGYGRWIKARETVIEAKGKGTLQTYWLLDKTTSDSHNNKVTGTSSALSSDGCSSMTVSPSAEILSTETTKKQIGLIVWMTEVLADYVKQIVAKNRVLKTMTNRSVSYNPPAGTICRDELVESFDLFKIDQQSKMKIWEEYVNVELSPIISNQIRLYVEEIAARYDSTNPFHNFEHASQ